MNHELTPDEAKGIFKVQGFIFKICLYTNKTKFYIGAKFPELVWPEPLNAYEMNAIATRFSRMLMGGNTPPQPWNVRKPR
jgi:hypothetical protein